jgi:hypothetical protein
LKGVKGRENGRGLKAAINCLNWLAQREGKRKEAVGHGDHCGSARPGGAQEKEGEEEGRGGADRRAPGVSDSQKKKMKKGKAGRCGGGLSGLLGCWAEKVR